MSMTRRTFLGRAGALAAGPVYLSSCAPGSQGKLPKLIVLGVDGMDPGYTASLMHRGLLPNIARIAEKGGFSRMSTTMPPQSPVAWSSIVTGAPPSVHGVFDFIHRDPREMQPYFSLSRISPPDRTLDVGGWNIPLNGGEAVQLRKGIPFWHHLAKADIPATLFKMPTNFPVMEDGIDMVSGMGTPDLRGGYGNSTVFTTDTGRFPSSMDGGRAVTLTLSGDRADTELSGPTNTLRDGNPETAIPVTFWRDSERPVVRMRIQDHDLVLGEGDWTGWLRIEFPVIGGLYGISAIIKAHVVSVHPHLTVYISPLNIDPGDAALPIFSSDRYARELANAAGPFYTQGFPEDTKALSNGVLSEEAYHQLADQVFDERNRMLAVELDRFERRGEGLLFFYYSSVDQNSHMYWRLMDTTHPLYDSALAQEFGGTLTDYYMGIDQAVGRILDRFDLDDPEFAIMLMSDHGFTSFRRQVNLNTWLHEQGLLALTKPELDNTGYFEHVDWGNTQAYNLGINSIYLNLKGRELYGGLHASLAERTRASLRDELLALRDPATGEQAITQVTILPDQVRRTHPHAPDLIVGWNDGYRTSWESILGGFSPVVFGDNMNKWSGDHCMAPDMVPATLIASRAGLASLPSLTDLSAAICGVFGIDPDETEQHQ